jgi:site-specific recombinase XerC
MHGVPRVQVQRWLGHADITMTCRYAHLSPDFGAEMVDRLAPPRPGSRGGMLE